MKLSEVQELAVQAVIGSWVGREVFDDFFLGMECGHARHSSISLNRFVSKTVRLYTEGNFAVVTASGL